AQEVGRADGGTGDLVVGGPHDRGGDASLGRGGPVGGWRDGGPGRADVVDQEGAVGAAELDAREPTRTDERGQRIAELFGAGGGDVVRGDVVGAEVVGDEAPDD